MFMIIITDHRKSNLPHTSLFFILLHSLFGYYIRNSNKTHAYDIKILIFFNKYVNVLKGLILSAYFIKIEKHKNS